MKSPRQGPIVLLLALGATLLGACESHNPTPLPTQSATPSQSAGASPSQSARSSSSLASSASPGPTSGAASAAQALRAYEDALLAGEYQKAWYLLSSTTRARWASLDAFTRDRTAYLARAGTRYTMEISPTNTLSMSQWLVGISWASKIDQKNAFLFSVRWSGFAGDPAKAEIWIASPIFTGWDLYLMTP